MSYIAANRPSTPLRFRGGHLRGRVLAEHDSAAMREVLADPAAFMYSDAVTVLKDNARSRVIRSCLNERPVVVKQNHAKTRGKAVKRAFLPSRAARAWHAAFTVEASGVPTAGALAYVEERTGPLRGRSWLVSDWVPGEDAFTCLTSPRINAAERTRMVRAIVDIYARLHRARITHGDNRPENFLVHQCCPVLLDLDVTVRHPRWSIVFRRYARRDATRVIAQWWRAPEIAEEFRCAFRDYGFEGV